MTDVIIQAGAGVAALIMLVLVVSTLIIAFIDR
jgi:hypothetical protein